MSFLGGTLMVKNVGGNFNFTDIKAGLIIVSAVFLLIGSQAQGGEEMLAPIRVTPHETGVLLLPTLDTTGDSGHMQAPRQLVVRHRIEYEFITRRFKMLGETMAAKAAEADPKIELGDLSARTAGSLDLMAKRTGADWVVAIVVEEAKLDSSAGGEFKVHTRVRLQVWDARRHGWLAHNPYTGQAGGGGSPVFVFKSSLDDATRGSLGNLLGVYPRVVTVLQEDSLNDYLAGQTRPFVGSPKKPFSGLKAEQ